ncbi:MAG: TrbI/VirB10 family protein [Neisseriaceae bacterium]|jgi:type IV secretory pathway VirB10-like protein
MAIKLPFGFTGLKSTPVKMILALLAAGLIFAVAYTLSKNDTEPKAEIRKEKDDVRPLNNLNVVVQNLVNILPSRKVQASTTIIISKESNIIPMESSTESTVSLTDMGQFKQEPKANTQGNNQVTEQDSDDKSPTMAVIDDSPSSTDDNNSTNPISGVNSSIGTGKINSKLEKLKNPYTIFAGEIIPIILDTPINSDKPGIIRATVARNVYDSVTLKNLLIPQGAKVVGVYDNKVAYAVNRLIVGWNRLIYPNGYSINLKGQPGTDLQGFSGFSDTVDNHYGKVFGTAFVTGAIFGAQAYAMGNQTTNPYQLSAGATIAQQVGAQMANTGIQLLQKGLDIPPTIIINAGYQGGIALTQDLVLKKYVFTKKHH